MNNTDKSTINALYQDALNLLASVFMGSDKEAITKATAKVVAYQEIMNALNVPMNASAKGTAPKKETITGGYQPTVAPAEIKAPTAPPAYKPKDAKTAELETLIAKGASPAEIFAAMDEKKVQATPKKSSPLVPKNSTEPIQAGGVEDEAWDNWLEKIAHMG